MKRILWMIPVILVSVGFFSCSTDAEDDDNPFAGTWESTVADGVSRKIIMNNDLTWEFHQTASGDAQGDTRGTYTYDGKTATAIASELYTGTAWVSTEGQPANVITVTAEIQDDGKLKVTAYDGTFTYTKKN
ncbi:MAG: hypothetical protein LBF75_01635 [Treponema sp.]|jgi:hypothetical protein|nr:hypothetical protein [Treponema sp.]